jgi:thiamine-phosphate pyrophosphorylase
MSPAEAGDGQVETRLYLEVPAAALDAETLETWTDRLAAALEAGEVACVLLRAGAADETRLATAIARLRPVVQSREVAFLLEGHPELAARSGCDGVHLEGAAGIAAARAALGESAIVGVDCGASRHEAMLAGEADADYVAFGGREPARLELLSWWQALMVVPCVAFGAETLAAAAEMARAGADFVALGEAFWSGRQNPAAAVATLAAELAGTERTA